MKTFEELTDEEVLALTPEQTTRYVDLACAENGVPLLPEPPGDRPPTGTVQPDTTVYDVAGIQFLHEAEARCVADTLNKLVVMSLEYLRGPGYQKKAVRRDASFVVSPVLCFSESLADKMRDAIAAAEQAKSDYLKEREAYDKITSAREKIMVGIRERVAAVKANQERRQEYELAFARYLDLAEGKRRIAARFMLAAYPNAEQIIPAAFVFNFGEPDEALLTKPRSYQNEAEPEPDPEGVPF